MSNQTEERLAGKKLIQACARYQLTNDPGSCSNIFWIAFGKAGGVSTAGVLHYATPKPGSAIWCDDKGRYLPVISNSWTYVRNPFYTNRQEAVDSTWRDFKFDGPEQNSARGFHPCD